MPLLKDKDRDYLKQEFTAKLTNPVRLVMFTQALECETCADTRALVEEVAGLSDKIAAEIYNFAIDKDKVAEYSIDKIPAIAVIGAKDYGIRFYGIPSGYEFATLVEDIVDVSRSESGLSPEIKSTLAKLKTPMHLQVFITPT
jgi:glutaredoxin-like protein